MLVMLATLAYEKYWRAPKYPKHDFSGQTIIVTGANTGLGLEAAQHFVRLGAEKVILAVRSLKKGEDAQKSIQKSTGRVGVTEVWQLDLGSYQSVKEFAERANGLKRLDAVVENAGIATFDYKTLEDNESTITVNVVSTFLLALLILPKLRESGKTFGITPRLTIVASQVHAWPKFEERKADNIFETINSKETAVMGERYPLSKLLEVLTVKEIADKTKSSEQAVTINVLDPGFCKTELARDATGLIYFMLNFQKALVGKTAEVGSRTLVHAAAAGTKSHGKYMRHGIVNDENASPFVRSREGVEVQRKVWEELSEKLENIQPGILKNLI